MRILFTILLSAVLFTGAFASGGEGFGFDYDKGDPLVKEFTVYPNPTSGDLTVSLVSFDQTKALDLKVYNLIGQELEKQHIAPFNGNHDVKLQLDKYPKGIYMIEISNGKESKTRRVSVI